MLTTSGSEDALLDFLDGSDEGELLGFDPSAGAASLDIDALGLSNSGHARLLRVQNWLASQEHPTWPITPDLLIAYWNTGMYSNPERLADINAVNRAHVLAGLPAPKDAAVRKLTRGVVATHTFETSPEAPPDVLDRYNDRSLGGVDEHADRALLLLQHNTSINLTIGALAKLQVPNDIRLIEDARSDEAAGIPDATGAVRCRHALLHPFGSEPPRYGYYELRHPMHGWIRPDCAPDDDLGSDQPPELCPHQALHALLVQRDKAPGSLLRNGSYSNEYKRIRQAWHRAGMALPAAEQPTERELLLWSRATDKLYAIRVRDSAFHAVSMIFGSRFMGTSTAIISHLDTESPLEVTISPGKGAGTQTEPIPHINPDTIGMDRCPAPTDRVCPACLVLDQHELTRAHGYDGAWLFPGGDMRCTDGTCDGLANRRVAYATMVDAYIRLSQASGHTITSKSSRVTVASNMWRAGADAAEVRERLGHRTWGALPHYLSPEIRPQRLHRHPPLERPAAVPITAYGQAPLPTDVDERQAMSGRKIDQAHAPHDRGRAGRLAAFGAPPVPAMQHGAGRGRLVASLLPRDATTHTVTGYDMAVSDEWLAETLEQVPMADRDDFVSVPEAAALMGMKINSAHVLVAHNRVRHELRGKSRLISVHSALRHLAIRAKQGTTVAPDTCWELLDLLHRVTHMTPDQAWCKVDDRQGMRLATLLRRYPPGPDWSQLLTARATPVFLAAEPATIRDILADRRISVSVPGPGDETCHARARDLAGTDSVPRLRLERVVYVHRQDVAHVLGDYPVVRDDGGSICLMILPNLPLGGRAPQPGKAASPITAAIDLLLCNAHAAQGELLTVARARQTLLDYRDTLPPRGSWAHARRCG